MLVKGFGIVQTNEGRMQVFYRKERGGRPVPFFVLF